MYNIFRTETGRFMYAAQGSDFEVLAPVTETASTIEIAQSRCAELNNQNKEIPLDVRQAYQACQTAEQFGEIMLMHEKKCNFMDLCDKYKLPYSCMDKK